MVDGVGQRPVRLGHHNLKHPSPARSSRVASILATATTHLRQRAGTIDLVKAELAANRPCVIYFRQTATPQQPRRKLLRRACGSTDIYSQKHGHASVAKR